ncbi:hypothetical protein EJ02DRAFT_268805 [Clathrospora elynae]|uniref:Uncharacterized protein n=1 Tax=Clathrospora elynae TaxID=706981 RepID=A0A6A5SGU1_9PLEO|nr:hypothetical protein EJ02DRAFT_268805 [Clathrospora elynae]
MAPNLFVATQKAFQPHKWFKSPKSEKSRVVEEWSSPVPGRYESIPGRGWFLIATLKERTEDSPKTITEGDSAASAKPSPSKEYTTLERPVPVKYHQVAKRHFLEPEYNRRKRTLTIKDKRGKEIQAGYFRIDDVTWIRCWDEHGTFIPGDVTGGEYQRWVFDTQTQQFRHMLKRDDPNYVRSRRNSPDRDLDSHSQDSVSDKYRSSRPGSTKNSPSMPSSQANSIRYMPSNTTSNPPSQLPSRQSSPKRNDSLPSLEEAKATLRRLAREHEEAAAALTRSRTDSKEHVQQFERGRAAARVEN